LSTDNISLTIFATYDRVLQQNHLMFFFELLLDISGSKHDSNQLIIVVDNTQQ